MYILVTDMRHERKMQRVFYRPNAHDVVTSVTLARNAAKPFQTEGEARAEISVWTEMVAKAFKASSREFNKKKFEEGIRVEPF